MITPFHWAADPQRTLQRPLPYVEAAHAASEIDDDEEEEGEDPHAFVRGMLVALMVALVGALFLWLWAPWAAA